MENASKALLIAGAILLVIAIIAIGVGIVSKTRGTIDVAEGQMSAMEIQMHNNQFKEFESAGAAYDKTFEEVRECVRLMMSVNETNKNKRDNIMYLSVVNRQMNSGVLFVDDKKNNVDEQNVKDTSASPNHNGAKNHTIQGLYNYTSARDVIINVNKYSYSSMYNITLKTDKRGYINYIEIVKEKSPVRVDEAIH